MNKHIRFLAVIIGAVVLIWAGAALGDYNVIISSAASANGSWSGAAPDVWTPNATGANVCAADIAARLTTGSVIITTTGGGTESGDISVNQGVSWSANTLTLNAARDIDINAVMTATGTSALTMNTTGGTIKAGFNADGTFKGRVDFPGRSGTGFLTINGLAYRVIDSLGGEESTTGTDLQGINGNLSGRYALGADIDASGTTGWNSSTGFEPIGSGTTLPFTGIFDGLGHTISGLSMNRTVEGDGLFGLFGYFTGTELCNVGLVNVDISGTVTGASGRNCSGALVGWMSGVTITNVYSSGSVSGTGPNNYIGGLVGFQSGAIANAYSNANVSGTGTDNNYTGGLVGFYQSGAITNVYSSGSVSGTGPNNFTGGLVGVYQSGAMTHAYNAGSVSGIATGTGSQNFSGGLVGFYQDGAITNAYNTGSISGTATGTGSVNYSGGLAGYYQAGTLDYAYNAGSVSGSGVFANDIGGLAGYSQNAVITHSFWDMQISGTTVSPGGEGKTTTEMKQAATFTGWSIDTSGAGNTIWRIYEGDTYPLLKSFLIPLTVRARDHSKPYDGTPYSGGNGVTYVPVDCDPGRIFGVPSYAGNSQGAIDGGTYEIVPAGLYSIQQGYDIEFQGGTLIILAPEILISGNGVVIADGHSSPSVGDHTDFGSADLAGTATRTFTIQNIGITNLILSGTTIIGSTNFTISALPAASIASGTSTTFTIQFDPDTTGLHTATVSIANNDADENPYTFTIQGTGTSGGGGNSGSGGGGGGGGGGGCFISATSGFPGIGLWIMGLFAVLAMFLRKRQKV